MYLHPPGRGVQDRPRSSDVQENKTTTKQAKRKTKAPRRRDDDDVDPNMEINKCAWRMCHAQGPCFYCFLWFPIVSRSR